MRQEIVWAFVSQALHLGKARSRIFVEVHRPLNVEMVQMRTKVTLSAAVELLNVSLVAATMKGKNVAGTGGIFTWPGDQASEPQSPFFEAVPYARAAWFEVLL